jgi:xylulokinase
MKYIGLDVGTSGCKAAVIDEEGSIIAAASREYSFETPSFGRVELNPDTVWEAALETLREIAPRSTEAAALAVSSIGETLVILDETEKTLANGIVYLDTRSEGQMAVIGEKISPRELYRVTGMPFHQMHSLSRLLWQRENTPRVLEKAAKIFMFVDFINYKLTGRRALDPGSAARTMLFDSKARQWSDRVMDLFEIPKDLFSPVKAAGTVIGPPLPEIARQTGLGGDTQIVLGCHDQASATLGAGVLGSGQLMLGEGSSESINAVSDYENIDEDVLFEKQITVEPFISRNECLISLGVLQHGTSIKWFTRVNKDFYNAAPSRAGESLYAKADRCCDSSSGELYFLPYLTRSNIMDYSSRALGCFIGLEYNTTVNTMYRAVLEGLAFESKYNMLTLEQTGYKPLSVTAAGGGAKSALLMQIKADALKLGIRVPASADSGLTGLAMICAVAMGEYSDYSGAAGHFVKIRDEYTPRFDYGGRFEKYVKINKTIRALYDEI